MRIVIRILNEMWLSVVEDSRSLPKAVLAGTRSVASTPTHRRAEAVAHLASCVAICSTILVLGWGATETNPVSRWLMDTVGTYTFALATPVLVSIMYRLLNVCNPGDWLYWYPATVLTLDALGNLYGLVLIGLPTTVAHTTWLGVGVSICLGVLAWAMYYRFDTKLLPHRYRSTVG